MKRFYKLLFIFLFMPLAVLSIAEVVFRLVLKVPKATYHRTTEKSDIYGPKLDEADMVFVGDSRVEWGFKPLVIQEALASAGQPMSCVNFAVPSCNGLDMIEYLEKRKIFPKYIVVGYSGNLGRSERFNFAIPESELKTQILCFRKSVLDYMKRNFIVLEPDLTSLRAWRVNKQAYFLRHEYDENGGVNVWIRGDYKERKDAQIASATRMREGFTQEKLQSTAEIYRRKAALFAKHGTKFITVRMPTADDIFALDPAPKFSLGPYVNAVLDLNFNGSACTPQTAATLAMVKKYKVNASNEQSITYDGSHLGHEASEIFSRDFARMLQSQLHPATPMAESSEE